MSDSAKPSLRELILVPSLITLAVTLLRLVGELQQWSPRFFNRGPGGLGALVGIVWLVPIFGVWFGLKLAAAGQGPERPMRAAGWAALALVMNMALGTASVVAFRSPVVQLALFTLLSWLTIAIAYPGWPALWRVLLAYGIAARVPVLLVMFFAIFGGWDSHYAKPRPDFPAMGPWGLFFWTALLPQASIWIFVTIVGGLLFGAAAVGIRGLASKSGPNAVPGGAAKP